MNFTGKNITDKLSDSLARIVSFLVEKEGCGEFEFSESVDEWEKAEGILDSLNLGYFEEQGFYTVALAYLMSQNNGFLDFSGSSNLWFWKNALIHLVQIEDLSPQCIADLVNTLETFDEKENSQLKYAVRLYSNNHFENGVELIRLLPEYSIYAKTGLMELDYRRYCLVFLPSDDPEFPEAAMPYFLRSLSELTGVDKETRESEILELLNETPIKFLLPVCSWIESQQETTPFVEQCILKLLNNSKENYKDVLTKVDHCLYHHHVTPELLKKIAEISILRGNHMDFLSMEHSLNCLYKESSKFLEFVLFFIIHPKGLYRLVGRALWDKYNLESSDFNPMDLPEDYQMIFVYFMLQDLGNPERRLLKVLPLLKSDSRVVRHAVVDRLLPYMNDYMGHVIKVMDDLQIDNEEAQALRQYFEKRSKIIQDRRCLKELAPERLYYNVYKEARRTEREHFQDIIRDSEKSYKPMWMDLMATVVLARGGGWRESDGKTRHLVPISCSVPSPVMVQSMSPMERDSWFTDMIKDWDDTERDN